jgi:hypothetical protein
MITYFKNGFIPMVCGIFSVYIIAFLLGTEYCSVVIPAFDMVLRIIAILLFSVLVWYLWYINVYLHFQELKDKISLTKDEYQSLMKELQKEREEFKKQQEKPNGE